MKNNLIKIIILAVLFVAVSQTGFCETAQDANNTQTELVVMMLKFGKVMFGVLLASAVIYVILLIWNAIIKRSNEPVINDLSLKTPSNTDDAIMFFINKNSLK